MSKSTYYTAVVRDEYFLGRVYCYKPDGNTIVILWTSRPYDTREQALDAAVEWMGDNGIEAEME